MLLIDCVSERFGSLTFAKRWLVCRAKGNVPNVGRLSAFLSYGSTKKLNLFLSLSFCLSFSNHFLCHFRCRCLFFALLVTYGNICSCRLRVAFLSSRTTVVAGCELRNQHGNGNYHIFFVSAWP
jgi:hypothetical protein